MLFRIPEPLVFPDPSLSEPSGLLGVGGDLSAERLLLAYQKGIFPWYSDGQPILWWSPDPRMVLHTEALKVPRSLAKRVRQRRYRITLDQAFGQVIRNCRATPRPGQDGTWLTDDMVAGYEALHAEGHAHSVEAWGNDDALVGGLYGVSVGQLYCGESMFAHAPDASKVAFVHLVRQLHRWGVPIVDCQVYTEHLARFGATEVPRAEYLSAIEALVQAPGNVGPWSFDDDFWCNG